MLIARVLLRCRPKGTIKPLTGVLLSWPIADLRTLADALDQGMMGRALKRKPVSFWSTHPPEEDD